MSFTTINGWQPSQKEKQEIETCRRIYSFECWVPETIAVIGDTYFFWDTILDVPERYREYCEQNKKVSGRKK